MRYSKMTMLNFMALCCIMGIFCKKLINPFANVITDTLHIPGGISTAFSIMFLVIAKEMVQRQNRKETLFKWAATLMGFVQGFVSLALGRVGSMGVLMPLSFIFSSSLIDLVYLIIPKKPFSVFERMVFSNALASLGAAVFANFVVFRLNGVVCLLYFSVASLSGLFFGMVGYAAINRLIRIKKLK